MSPQKNFLCVPSFLQSFEFWYRNIVMCLRMYVPQDIWFHVFEGKIAMTSQDRNTFEEDHVVLR